MTPAQPEADAAATGPYLPAILECAPRVVGMLDREPYGPSHGCMDRTWWAWKFTDFPGARFQEGLCALSWLYASPEAGAPWAGSERLREWIAAGFEFWCRIQRKEGDLDEAYPLERSLAATAFTSFYLSEAALLLGDALPGPTRERFVEGLARAGGWLCRNDETHGILSNHLAAAAGALVHAHRLTGEERFARRARLFLDRILAHQSSEGWYEEYGGADPGYQTHGSFYLARCQELLPHPGLDASLERSFRFLACFVHPDGSLGGEYASRNTQTYYPAAFEMWAGRSGSARWIADTLRPSVTSAAAAGLRSVDPYNLFPLLNNYVFAQRAWAAREGPGPAPEPPFPEGTGRAWFPDAGLLVERTPRYHAVLSAGKGGVLKLFDAASGALRASDCGYVGRLRDGGIVASQWADPERRIEVKRDAVVVEGGFVRVSRPVMRPVTFLGFRVVTLLLGRVPGLARAVKALLVRVLITRKRDVPLHLRRVVRFGERDVEVEDQLEGDAPLERLEQREIFTTIHMGSSRYFVPHEASLPDPGLAPVDVAELPRGVERRRAISFP